MFHVQKVTDFKFMPCYFNWCSLYCYVEIDIDCCEYAVCIKFLN